MIFCGCIRAGQKIFRFLFLKRVVVMHEGDRTPIPLPDYGGGVHPPDSNGRCSTLEL